MAHIPEKTVRLRVNRARNRMQEVLQRPEFAPYVGEESLTATEYDVAYEQAAVVLDRLADDIQAMKRDGKWPGASATFRPCRFEIDFEADACVRITNRGSGDWSVLQEAPSYLMLDGFQGEIVITVRVDVFRSPDDEERLAICVTRCTPDKYNTAVYNQQHWSQMEPPTNNPADWLTNVLNAFMTPGV